ncbi:uncharacterized protein F5891DRAFT_1191004 [Suillus fuscotomentosus]|uniref:Uncharacterized protein n=1 Tax=Suillus fuscotomentosus TaxID=1912939 RepID=A0AAD4HJ18_9AGAM|nr:uncharacterized protein F5891DRAFT_1191004 [Suillus fuscotomentosus]KAG1898332.1 hypothetical protein F5891DRAFT_1191004 [Suillus fuscotomentosus]
MNRRIKAISSLFASASIRASHSAARVTALRLSIWGAPSGCKSQTGSRKVFFLNESGHIYNQAIPITAPTSDAPTTNPYKCSATRVSRWSNSSRPYVWYRTVMFPHHHRNHMDGLTDLKMRCAQSIHKQVLPEDRSPAKEEDTSSEVSIDDICIGPAAAAADNSLDSSSSENGGESSMSGTETLADLDPALEFNCNKTTEQAKSRTHWRVRSCHFNDDVVALFRTLDQLSTELGYKSGVPEARIMQSRVIAVLRRVRATKLHDAVQQLECTSGTGYHLLLKQSQELVDLMERRLAIEKEVISIIDEGGVEAYDEAMFANLLIWQTVVDISDKS